MRTINEVRQELRLWGNFWSNKKKGQGYASKSNLQSLSETLQIGCAIQGTSYLVNHCSDSIHVPEHVNQIGVAIDKLKPEYIKAIRQRYVVSKGVFLFNNKKLFLRVIDKAEVALM